MFMFMEKLIGVDSSYDIDRNVWCFMLESSVNIDISINGPASMTESLKRVKFVPFTRFCIIDF